LKDIIKDILYPAYLGSTGVSKDTRTIEPGNIYFALKGENFDGNEYAQDALDKGAAHIVIDINQGIKESNKVILVNDVLQALQNLAKYHRKKINGKVIALTGSNGKTTTKELLYSILKKHDKSTYATIGNLNNHIGVPLTILSMPIEAHFAIVEMGTNQPGDIEELCSIAQPDYGLITNIGKTHLEKLISQEGVFKEKSSLYNWLIDNHGIFFKNEGDTYIKELDSSENLVYSSFKTIQSKILKSSNDINLSIDLIHENRTISINTNLFGEYNIENLSAAISVAEYFSVSYEIIEKAINAYRPSNMRSQIIKTKKNTIIMDAYNSNPISLRDALVEFSKLEDKSKVAIIGDMLELGHTSQAEHQNIVNLVSNWKDMTCIFVGQEFQTLKNDRIMTFTNIESCIEYITSKQFRDKSIFLKGSRGIQLEKIMPFL